MMVENDEIPKYPSPKEARRSNIQAVIGMIRNSWVVKSSMIEAADDLDFGFRNSDFFRYLGVSSFELCRAEATSFRCVCPASHA